MIKAVILDVDGVIVGNKQGVNFPLPHKDVLHIFQKLDKEGIPLILCTAKFNFAILEIIKKAKLKNPHITDGGALIINPLDNKIIKKYTIKRDIVKECASIFLKENIYIEIYTAEKYYVKKSQYSEFTEKRTKILQTPPQLVDFPETILETEDVIKLIAFAQDEKSKESIQQKLSHISDNINLLWTMHPYILPKKIAIITAKGVSKQAAAKESIQNLGIAFDEVLGIGDTKGDWNFMQLCKYVATLENGDDEIKELVKSKKENSFIAPHIDENGVLDIFKHFELI